jgi:hypothetical protein
MVARRSFLTLLGAGLATGSIGLARDESHLNGQTITSASQAAAPDACGDTFADPSWKRLSSANGDLPIPQTSDQ